MNTEYVSLGPSENSTAVRLIRIIFGAVCIAIALFWIIFNFMSVKADRTLWITVLFLSGFGIYQIWAGAGRAKRFIEIGNAKIILRKNSLLPRRKIAAGEIKKIEVYPFNLIIYFNKGGRTILRFGTDFTDVIEPVKDAVRRFAGNHNIDLENVREEI